MMPLKSLDSNDIFDNKTRAKFRKWSKTFVSRRISLPSHLLLLHLSRLFPGLTAFAFWSVFFWLLKSCGCLLLLLKHHWQRRKRGWTSSAKYGMYSNLKGEEVLSRLWRSSLRTEQTSHDVQGYNCMTTAYISSSQVFFFLLTLVCKRVSDSHGGSIKWREKDKQDCLLWQ